MHNDLKIYIDRLKDGHSEKIKESVTYDLLDIENEEELKFTKPIFIEGKAYITNESLIINLDIKFYISMPCLVCNEFIEKEIEIKNLYITEKLDQIDSTYELKEDIRNACFLEIPSYIECLDNCPQRSNIKKYLNETKENYPFSNLKE